MQLAGWWNISLEGKGETLTSKGPELPREWHFLEAVTYGPTTLQWRMKMMDSKLQAKWDQQPIASLWKRSVAVSSSNRNINQTQTDFDITCFSSPGSTFFFSHSLWPSPGSGIRSWNFLLQISFYRLIHLVNKNEHPECIMLLEDPLFLFFKYSVI